MAMTVHAAPLRRLRLSRVLVFVSGVLLCFVYTLSLRAQPPPRASAQRDGPLRAAGGDNDARAGVPEGVTSSGMQEEVLVLVVNRTDLEQCVYVDPKPLPAPSPPTTFATPPTLLQPPHRGDFPEDLFSLEQRQQGWVVLHVAGMVYTWWPLFRDVSFYVLDLTMLIVFFLDNAIVWWESVLLVLAYVTYVSFMKFNGQIEQAVKFQINKHMSVVKVWTADEPEKESEAPPPPAAPAAPPLPAAPPTAPKNERKPEPDPEPPDSSPPSKIPRLDQLEDAARLRVRPVLLRGGSTASLHNASLRNTIFQLMIHTLDPLGEAGPSTSQSQNPDQRADKTAGRIGWSGVRDRPDPDQSQAPAEAPDGSAGGVEDQSSGEESSGSSESDDGDDGSEEEEKNEPLSLDWPETGRKQVTYLLLLPILLPLWLTLPDVRNLASRRYFVMTFIGSILWIGVFSYMMVWWAHQVGETVGISEEIMGLTILAAGTSIPDLITSVIVARKGLGDMAVSSSVGSNIFDITIGLPVPWLLYTVLHNGEPVEVSSNGLFCAIVLLFLMLHFVIISIAACRWKMSRTLGLTMFVLYFIFLVLSVLLEKRVLVCPVSI